jgi:hypothetical protein
MAPRPKYLAVAFGGFAVIFTALIVTSEINPKALPFVLFPAIAIVGGYSMTIRCPNCRRPVGYWGYGFWGGFGFPPRLCRKCGRDLDEGNGAH